MTIKCKQRKRSSEEWCEFYGIYITLVKPLHFGTSLSETCMKKAYFAEAWLAVSEELCARKFVFFENERVCVCVCVCEREYYLFK